MKTKSVPHPKRLRTYTFANRVVSWTVEKLSLVWPLLACQSSTRRLAMEFECFCRLSQSYTYLTCRNCICQHSIIVETIVKQHAFAFIMFDFHIGIPGFVYTGAIFSAVYIRHNFTHQVPGFRQTVVACRRSWHCSVKAVSPAYFISCNGV